MKMQESIWIRSISEFKKLKVVVFCGMMAAVAIVLNYVASINIGDYIRIGFSGLPNQIVCYLFGPAIGTIFGAALDIIKFILKPTGPFFPGFTISAAAGGLIYGLFLYRRKVTLVRVLLAQITVKIFVNIVLNTLWVNMLYGKAITAILPARIVSNAIMLPIDTIICFLMLTAVERSIMPYFRHDSNT